MNEKLTNEEKLNEIYELVHENHKILKSLHRQQSIGTVFRIIYWLAILGALGGVYYYISPLIGMISGNSGKVEEKINEFNQIKNQLPEGRLINSFFEGMQKSATASVGQDSTENTSATDMKASTTVQNP